MFKIFYEKSSDNNLSLLDLAKINKIKDPCGAKIDGKIYELNYIPDKNCDIEFLNFEDVDGKKIYFHTACHVMAQAIKRIYPDAKLGFGPPTESGFYYDIDFSGKEFLKDDIPKVEKEIKKIISENIPVVKKTVSIEEAHEIMKKRNEVYKL
jgi:threonyl-tRNA synthetase